MQDSYFVSMGIVNVKIEIKDSKDSYIPKYIVKFPKLDEGTEAIYQEIKNRLISQIQLVSYDISEKREELKKEFLIKARAEIEKLLPGINENTKKYLVSRLISEMLGLGELEILLADPNLEEVVVNSSKEPVQVYHKKYGWLITNIKLKSEEEIANYASIIGRTVRRQITNLTPLLDAHLPSGDRVNATLYPISNEGNTITIRKFRKVPWTIPEFIANKTISAEIAALLWLAVQYEQNILISGGTGTGKTSFLTTLMPFIPPNQRIISIEDTREIKLPDFLHWVPLVTREPNQEGQGEVCMYPGSFVVKADGELCEISEYVEKMLAEGNVKKINNVIVTEGNGEKILAGDPNTMEYSEERVKTFSKVMNRKYICDIICEDGTKFSITENTKLPVLTKDGKISLLNPFEIKEKGSHIPVYTKININCKPQKIKLFEIFDSDDIYACNIKEEYLALEKNLRKKFKLKEIAKKCNVTRQSFGYYRKTGNVNMKILKKMIEMSDYSLSYFEDKIEYLKSRGGSSNKIKIPKIVDEDLAYLAGFILAEKYISKNRIMFSQKEDLNYIKNLVRKIFGIDMWEKREGKYNYYGIFSTVISRLMQKVFGATYANKIRVPKVIMKSPESVIASFLAGYIDGDGSVDKRRISLYSISRDMIYQLKYLFLRLGIMSTIYNSGKTGHAKNDIYNLNILTRLDIKKACKLLNFKRKQNIEKAKKVLKTTYKESVKRDRVPIVLVKKHLQLLKDYLDVNERYKFYYRYIENDESSISRERLKNLESILSERINTTKEEVKSLNALKEIINKEITYIKIKKVSIKENKKNIPSYDLTPEKSNYFVAGSGNFTLIEDTMLDLLVNSLRMRPDRIILGEIRRSREAEVLFEAMHTGHSVYGTIHADTAMQTYRRLITPPISVPETLLEAIDMFVVMFRDRRRGIRRVYEIAEIPYSTIKTVEKINVMYRWDISSDKIYKNRESKKVVPKLKMMTGLSDEEIEKEIKNREKVLMYMVKKNITDVNSVGKLISSYIKNPKEVLKKIR